MQGPAEKSRLVRFGPFEVDLQEAELRKNGVRIKLQEQPFQVLAALLERPGETVTREELRQLLWPADTFVDFDHSLNSSINRLRETLGDDPETPRFIQTWHRRGYRFIAPVDSLVASTPPASPKQRTKKNVALVSLWILVLVALLIALNAGQLRDRWLGRSGARQIGSLAVLPVKNFSGDPGQEFFADGMTDALIAGLAQIKAVRVISRTSVMHYKGTSETLPQIARELGVDSVIEASVIRSGDRVRLTAQLIDAQDRHLWASAYDRQMTDVLTLQSELVRAIAEEIRVQVTPEESRRLKTARRVDSEVYDTTLKGKATLEYATREDQFQQAIELFQKAIDRDPTYAPAWAGLGEAVWCLAGSITGNEWVAPGDVREKAIAAADKALELDPDLAEAHKARAVIAFDGEWDIAKAAQHFERALELRPGYAAAHVLYAELLSVSLQRHDDARRHLDRARELDPLSPWNDPCLLILYFFQGQYEKVIEEGARALERDPTAFWVHDLRGNSQVMLGRPSHAVPEFEAALKLLYPERPPKILGDLGLAYGLAGRRADATKILAELESMSHQRYVSPLNLAQAYSGLGRMDEAFRLLDQALEQRTPFLISCTPHEDSTIVLRRDPRWEAFIEGFRRKLRLPSGALNPYS